MNTKIRKILNIFFITLIVVSLLYIVKIYYDIYTSHKESNLLNEITLDNSLPTNNIEPNSIMQDSENTNTENVKTEKMLKLEELQKENQDIVAWIEIENTNINYPVLQCEDNDFYINHNYKKDYSVSGAIFLDKAYSWNPPSTNLLIYGHNMINNTMFTNLLNYRSQDYYNAHPNIKFTTTEEDATYRIFSVFPSRTYYQYEQNVFRYYFFVNAKDEQDFNNFVSNAKKSSLYDTGITAEYGDSLMTLSTCAYHTENGKFAVVAKKIVD